MTIVHTASRLNCPGFVDYHAVVPKYRLIHTAGGLIVREWSGVPAVRHVLGTPVELYTMVTSKVLV